ncbi:Regulator of chromosome condensation, RCC1 [Lasallia pustulata]|uniref:Regulator of chromosome condensation, RCC1 n=1 Tax=Lasallia pustulata TaxID=136370 RepID=A0A1W5CT26_9LECA|nr:Regulator of chromosome condensation, RCC1 [Lasallia pustulata]
MSTYLWKYYLEHDLESFQQLLAGASYIQSAGPQRGAGANVGATIGSPGAILATSPKIPNKHRKASAPNLATPSSGGKGHRASTHVNLTRADINSKDAHGVTLLHHIASSTDKDATQYASALLEIPLLDLYLQDVESGWTALHRALYFGNATIARALMDRDARDAISYSAGGPHSAVGLIKVKDREGNSPFDVFGATITNRSIRQGTGLPLLPSGIDEDDDDMAHGDSGDADDDNSPDRTVKPRICIEGDELFTFGSNKNLTLGFGNEDDRQYPERILLKRPDHLLRRLDAEHQVQRSCMEAMSRRQDARDHDLGRTRSVSNLPAVIRNRPIIIQDIRLSKLHSAVLTTDPEANLYTCGFGPGGRLGTGDETTRFGFVPIYGGGLAGKKVVDVGLGQNHTVVVSNEGEVFTWGTNVFGQLGYALPTSTLQEEEPVQTLPRQIFGPLKREIVIGAAASRTHSAVHTNTSLYTFGKNDGQLGLVDSDARSLETQIVPRKVAASLFSSSISMVSAIERATVCLLNNHDVWIFANYGYTKMSFPLEGFSDYFLQNSLFATRHDSAPNHINKVASGGDTICAMSRMGDVFTVHVTQKAEPGPVTTSTTNPAKIRGALSQPQRVWSLRKGHMAVRDVDVGQDGSIIICTESGSVWRRVKRAKIKDANAPRSTEYKAKDYKFSRVPSLTRVVAVRSNPFGAFAAVRRDCDVLKNQLQVDSPTLWEDLFPLLPFSELLSKEDDSETENPTPRFWAPAVAAGAPATIRKAVLTSADLESDVTTLLSEQNIEQNLSYDLRIGSSTSQVVLPVHEFMLAGRSGVIRQALVEFRQSYFYSTPDVMTIEYDKDGRPLILFQGVDFITIFNLVFFIYADCIVDVWHHARHAPALAARYRQIRTELMKLASHLELPTMEQAARVMIAPAKTLHQDLGSALMDSSYLETGDVEVELDDASMKVHSALMCRRCPFFEGLFNGRAAGRWLASRRELVQDIHDNIKVDLKHVNLEVFKLVLRYIYADAGEELFDEVVTTDLDEFLDLVLEVMSVANELMLDRLAQICQKLLGRFVTLFKDAALEYICLNLEGMLENHLLKELDQELMAELDEIVRQNQLACLPFVKSGRAEAELLEKYPDLVDIIDRGKRAKINSMALQSRLYENEIRFAGSIKARSEDQTSSPSTEKSRQRPSKDRMPSSKSPSLRAKTSVHDLMFDMDEGDGFLPESSTKGVRDIVGTPVRPESQDGHVYQTETPSSLSVDNIWFDSKGKALLSAPDNALATPQKSTSMFGSSPSPARNLQEAASASLSRDVDPSESPRPWGSAALSSTKLDMKAIMAQASLKRESNISSGLSSQAKIAEAVAISVGNKMSQRERKRQQQQQQLLQSSEPRSSPENGPPRAEKPASPWRTPSAGPKISLKDVLGADGNTSPSSTSTKDTRLPSVPPLTLRQTVPGSASAARKFPRGGQPAQPSPQHRNVSSPTIAKPTDHPSFPNPSSRPPTQPSSRSHQPIQSIPPHHNPLPVEPSLHLSMADILSQQQTEKDVIKEAAAKRSLQDIQQEQEFQQWWDMESRKVMEEEAAASGEAAARREPAAASRGEEK